MKNERLDDWSARGKYQRPLLQSPSEGRLISYCLPAPNISAAAFLQHATGQERVFWQSSRDQSIFAGFGIAVQIMAWGAGRFQEIKRKMKSIFSDAVQLNEQTYLAQPRFFGGFAFRDDFAPDNAWAAFHPAHFVLPHYQLVKQAGHTWLIINALVTDDDDLSDVHLQLHEALLTRLGQLSAANTVRSEHVPDPSLYSVNFPLNYERWRRNVEEIVAKINNSNLEKMVLSRVCELRAADRIDVTRALAYLNEHYVDCTRFLFEPRPYHAFYGATPELLVDVKGRQLQTMALAGSIRRGEDHSEDIAMARQLMDAAKDRHEHQLVVDSIRRRLEPFAGQLGIPRQPDILTLSYIHHLITPVNGQLNEELGVLPLLEILHPTPALGGSPRELALDFIRDVEPVPRGWYAGPIGWINSQMDGQFVVGIRSAIAQDRRVWLYAGAGIVAESDPRKEWLETSLKFKPMFAALDLQLEQGSIPLAQKG